MSSSPGKLLAEMALIFLVAAALGIAWNHRILCDAWTGREATGEKQTGKNTPLPLGLMQAKELYDRKEAAFVDARDAKAFAVGHIKGAVSLPAGEFGAQLRQFRAQVPTTATLLVYCNGYDCHDSREVGSELLENGYLTVYVFEGGFPEWRDAGYPATGGER